MQTIKQYFILLFPLWVALTSNAQKNDSTSKEANSHYFIDVRFGEGLGWRTYPTVGRVPENIYKANPKNEDPGNAHYFGLNFGFSKNKWNILWGAEYIYASYKNDKAPITYSPNTPYATTTEYKYIFIHKIYSFPISLSLLLGKRNKWYTSLRLGPGVVTHLLQKSEVPLYKISFDTDYTFNQVLLLTGVSFGRKIITSKKIDLGCEYSMHYSSRIGSKWYEDNNRNQYGTRPRSLLIPAININLKYKF